MAISAEEAKSLAERFVETGLMEVERSLTSAMKTHNNIIYESLIEKTMTPRILSMETLSRTTTLLKMLLAKHTASVEVLAKMDHICSRLLTGVEHAVHLNPTTTKNLSYIRTLVVKIVTGLGPESLEKFNGLKIAQNQAASKSRLAGSKSPTPSSASSSVASTPSSSPSPSPTPPPLVPSSQSSQSSSSSSSSVTLTSSDVPTLLEPPTAPPPFSGVIIEDLSSLRSQIAFNSSASSSSAAAGAAAAAVPCALHHPPILESNILGGQFPPQCLLQDASQRGYLGRIESPDSIASTISLARASRKKKGNSSNSSPPLYNRRSTLLGGPRTLFQCKSYAMQLPLSITRHEFDQVVDTALSFSVAAESNARASASNLVIKMWMDAYVRELAIAAVSLAPPEDESPRPVSPQALATHLSRSSARACVLSALLPSLAEGLHNKNLEQCKHVLNMILNASVHASLFDESMSLAVPGPDGLSAASKAKPSASQAAIQDDLWGCGCELLLYAHDLLPRPFQSSFDSFCAGFWAIASRLVIALGYDHDPVHNKWKSSRLSKLDIRVLNDLTDTCCQEGWEPSIYSSLLYAVLAKLYPNTLLDEETSPAEPEKRNRNEFKISELNKIGGGISFLLRHYRSTTCLRTRQSLFTAIFDRILFSLVVEKQVTVSAEQAGALFAAFSALKLPIFLYKCARNVPNRFVERLVKSLFLHVLQNQNRTQLKASLDKALCVAFLYEAEHFLTRDSTLDPQFNDHVANVDTSIPLLKSLLNSKDGWERRQGLLFLSTCLRQLDQKSSSSSSSSSLSSSSSVENTWRELVWSFDPSIRRMYLEILQIRIDAATMVESSPSSAVSEDSVALEAAEIMSSSSSASSSSGGGGGGGGGGLDLMRLRTSKAALKILNDGLEFYCNANDRHSANSRRAVDILLEALVLPIFASSSSSAAALQSDIASSARTSITWSSTLTYCDLLLCGRGTICLPLIQDLNPSIPMTLLRNLLPTIPNEPYRACLVLILGAFASAKRTASLLEAGGGFQLFKALLKDSSPLVAALASKIMMELLMTSMNEKYHQSLTRLLQAAAARGDTQLLSSSFLQVIAIADDLVVG